MNISLHWFDNIEFLATVTDLNSAANLPLMLNKYTFITGFQGKFYNKYSSIVIQELYSFKPKRTSFVNELSSTLVSFVTI